MRTLLSVYHHHQSKNFLPFLYISTKGIRVGEKRRKNRLGQITVRLLEIEDELERLTGRKLYAKKSLSNKKLGEYLYGDLGLRPIRGKANAAEVTIRRLMLRNPSKLEVTGALILEHRRLAALRNFFREQRVDDDGYFRSSYKITADSGRTKSAKNPMGTGSNGQNSDRESRGIFLPDRGCCLVEFDLSQIEDRIVKYLTGSERLRRLAARPPWDGDIHKETAAAIFRISESEVTKAQRYLGKRTRHAWNYGMGPEVFSDTLLKDGVVLTPEECKTYLEAMDRMEPEVLEWQRETRSKLLYERELRASCGFRWRYDQHRLDRETYKAAYATIPQHEAVCILNTNGLRPLGEWMAGQPCEINIHNHDALIISCAPELVPDLVLRAFDVMETPRMIRGAMMPVYIEAKVGKDWGTMPVGWNRCPERDEVEEAVRGLAGSLPQVH